MAVIIKESLWTRTVCDNYVLNKVYYTIHAKALFLESHCEGGRRELYSRTTREDQRRWWCSSKSILEHQLGLLLLKNLDLGIPPDDKCTKDLHVVDCQETAGAHMSNHDQDEICIGVSKGIAMDKWMSGFHQLIVTFPVQRVRSRALPL